MQKTIREYGFETHPISRKFDNNKGIYENNIFYGVPHRKLNINLINIFNKEENYEIIIAEDAVVSVFEGTASKESLEQFLNFLKLRNYNIRFLRQDNNKHYSAITDENITKCTTILLENDLITVRILKNKKYDVSFQNLTEDLVLNRVELYPLQFKLIDNDWNKDITSMNLQSFIKVRGLNDTVFLDNGDIFFDNKNKVYVANIDVKEVKNKVNKDYWLTNANLFLEVNIIDKESGNSLRSQDIKIITNE